MDNTSPDDRESRFPVGSSPKMIAGLPTSARAHATRCCCPPESSLGRWSSRSPIPSRLITVSYQSWSTLRPAMSDGSVMFSAAVKVGTRLNDWNTNPIRSRRRMVIFLSDRPVRSVSPMWTRPLVATSSPARQCIRVDLPDPDGPMMAVNSPDRNDNVTPRSAWTSVSPDP